MIYTADGQTYQRTPQARGQSAQRHKRLLASLRSERLDQAFQGWRGLQGGTPLYLMPHDMMLVLSYWLFFTNSIIQGMITKSTDILVGNGFDFKADDDQVQDALEDFWNDPVNDFPWNEDIYVTEAAIYGELCFTLYTNDYTNETRIGTLDPYDIEYTIPDTRNRNLVAGIKLKNGNEILKTIIAPGVPDEAFFSADTVALRQTFAMADGQPQECLYRAFNRRFVQDGSPYGSYMRGTPDLFAIFDDAEDIEEILASMRRRAKAVNRILWDVEIEGADETGIQEFLDNTDLPDEDVINAHNEKIKWQVNAPSLQASEHETQFRTSRNHAIGGVYGMPPTVFGDPTDANRATAQEMPLTMFKHLGRKQQKIGSIFRWLQSYQLWRKGLPYNRRTFDVIFPTLSEKDMERLTNAFARVYASLSGGEAQEYLSKEEARQIYRSGLEDLGYELGEYVQEPGELQTGVSSPERVTPDYRRLINASKKT